MKFFQSKIICMQENEIVSNFVDGFPDRSYPNSDIDGYHDFYELEFFTAGIGTHYIDGKPFKVKTNYAYLLLPGECHRIHLDEKTYFKLYNLKLAPDVPDKQLIADLIKHKGNLCVYFNDRDAQLIENEFCFLSDILNNGLYNQRMMKNSAERILNTFLCSLSLDQQSISFAKNDPVWNIIKYTESNFKNDLSLKQLADISGISENYVGIFFKKKTGLNFTSYLTKIRLYHALSLLNETDMLIKEISFKSGFSSPEYFTRIFTSAYGISPREYRKKGRSL